MLPSSFYVDIGNKRPFCPKLVNETAEKYLLFLFLMEQIFFKSFLNAFAFSSERETSLTISASAHLLFSPASEEEK
jgi:hypothetical protein